MEKQIVHSLWLGNLDLDNMQRLTVRSFVHHDATFFLWNYQYNNKEIEKNVILKNANEIIKKEKIFKYPSKMLLGFGENSYVGFSELFRYKVLYELGGWWSDMDVVCLKSLNEVKTDYWFRFHGVLSVVGNIMKCPPKSELMRLCYDRAVREVNAEQDDWHHAIRILCYYVEYLGLNKFIQKKECNIDRLDQVLKLINENNHTIPDGWRFIHWMNSVISKSYVKDSVMDRLYNQYKINKKIFI